MTRTLPNAAEQDRIIAQHVAGWAAEMDVSEAMIAELAAAYVGAAQDLWHRRIQKRTGPLVVGINGAQGSGKSTMSALLRHLLEDLFGARCAGLSLDDLYLTRAERRSLARTVHPLLATRGVPGTHDVALGLRVLDGLEARAPGEVAVPAFDKAVDDRLPEARWPRFAVPCDLIILEGWCVGARPVPDQDLIEPCNALEREHDADGSYRRYVNRCLREDYQRLFGRLDTLVMLKVPSFACVRDFRIEQEQALLRRLRRVDPNAKVMSDEEVEAFVAYFERITRAMLAEMPERADILVTVESDHRVSGVEIRGTRRVPASRTTA